MKRILIGARTFMVPELSSISCSVKSAKLVTRDLDAAEGVLECKITRDKGQKKVEQIDKYNQEDEERGRRGDEKGRRGDDDRGRRGDDNERGRRGDDDRGRRGDDERGRRGDDNERGRRGDDERGRRGEDNERGRRGDNERGRRGDDNERGRRGDNEDLVPIQSKKQDQNPQNPRDRNRNRNKNSANDYQPKGGPSNQAQSDYQRKDQKESNLTHFISIPVFNSKSYQKSWGDFKSIVALQNPSLKSYFYERDHHITLSVLSLSPEQEQKVAEILKKLAPEFRKITQPLHKGSQPIKTVLNDIDYFGKFPFVKVLFISVPGMIEKAAQEIVDLIVSKLLSEGIIKSAKELEKIVQNPNTKKFEYNKLHITLMKVRQHDKEIDLKSISTIQGFEFGEAEFHSLALRKMDHSHTVVVSVDL